MRNKYMKKMKKGFKKNKVKFFIEMADDFMDMMNNTKLYKMLKKKTKM